MKNYVSEGEVITYSNPPFDIASGQVVVVGELIGVALEDIEATTGTGAVALTGVYDLPKVDEAVIKIGESVIWIARVGKFDDNAARVSPGNVSKCAIAMESKGATTDGTIRVKINVGVGTVA